MLFDHLIELQEFSESERTIHKREAVRAIIRKGDHLLLIHSNKGDYKLPGGGVELGEDHVEALVREIQEETGYCHCLVKEKIGVLTERDLDVFNQQAYFQMTSHYYLCELIDEEKNDQRLDAYEAEEGFLPEWLTLEEALAQNQDVMEQMDMNRWIRRENYVLCKLLEDMNLEEIL